MVNFYVVFMHLTPFTPNPLFPLFPRLRSGQALQERGPGGEVPKEGGASAARKIVDSVLSMVNFYVVFMHLTPFTPNPLFPLSSEERGPGGEVPKEGGASAARKIVGSVLSMVNFYVVFMHLTPFTPNPLFPLFPRLRSGQALQERGPGGEVPKEGGASAARKIVDSVLSNIAAQTRFFPIPFIRKSFIGGNY
jgi:hypothetical protein